MHGEHTLTLGYGLIYNLYIDGLRLSVYNTVQLPLHLPRQDFRTQKLTVTGQGPIDPPKNC